MARQIKCGVANISSSPIKELSLSKAKAQEMSTPTRGQFATSSDAEEEQNTSMKIHQKQSDSFIRHSTN